MTGLLGLIVVIGALIMFFIRQQRQKKLATLENDVDSGYSFVEYYKSEGVSEELLGVLLKCLRELLDNESYEMKPDDNLYDDYKLFETEMRDLLTDISLALGLSNPSIDFIKSYEKEQSEILTVDDLVKFVVFYKK